MMDAQARHDTTTAEPTGPLETIDLDAVLARLRGEAPWRRGGRHARTLRKEADLRLVLVALRAGARLEEHRAPGRVTIHALDGRLRVGAAGASRELVAAQLATLAPAPPHDVEALEESAFLLTIAWHP